MDAEKLKKMMEKKGKKGNKLSENEIKAKMAVLNDIKERAESALGSKLKKVTVSSDTDEGLEKGLDMAKKIAKKKMEMNDDDEYENDEDMEYADEDEDEGNHKY